MATYNPPTQDLVIFDNSVFTSSNPTGNLTRAQADLLYLHFPFGQGAETIPSVSITGTSLLSGTVSANNNLLLGGVSGVNYLQFPNGTKQYEAALDYPTINNVWTGKNQFDGDLSLNSTAITINGVGLKINDLPYSATPLTNVLYIDSVTNQIIKSIAKNPEVNFNLNSETITLTSETGYSGVFNITSEAVFNSTLSTCPDYSIFSLSNSFTSTSTITINKPIYVRGNGFKINATAITTNVLSITSDNVVINNIILENSNASSNAGVIAVSNSISSKIVISNSTLNTNEFAITGTWNNLFILNNAFTFVGTTDSHRYIYPSSITGVCIINNNSFTGTSTNTRVVQLNSQSTYTGKMVFSNNTVTNSVSQVFESNGQVFTGMNFELYFVNNNTICSNGNVIFTTNGAGIKGIYAYNNITSMVSANTSKGLVAFSIGAAQIDPSINFYMDNNTVNGALRADYSDVSVLQNKSITSASVPYSYPLIASDTKINFYINSNTIVNDYFYSNNVNIQKLTTNNDVFMNNLVDDNTKTKILYYDNTTSKIFKGSLPASTLLSSDNIWSGKNQFNADVSLNSITSLTSDIYATTLASTSDANAVSYNTTTKKLGYVALPAAPSTLLASDNTWSGKNQFNGDVSLNAFTTIDGSKLNILSVPSTSDAANIAVFDIASNSIKYEPSGNIINATKSNLLASNNVWTGDNSFNNIQIASTKNINFAGTINISEAGTQTIYTSGGDLFLAPTGGVDLNGKTLNMTNGEIHNCPLIHSKNNENIKIEGKGTGGIILTSTNVSISGDLLTVTGLPSTADTNAVSYNTTTKRLGYVALGSGSSLLTSNNQWSGTQYFGADTSFNSDIYINNLPYSATDLSCVTYDTTTKKISFTTIPNLLPSINTWSAANTFSDTVYANNNLVLGGEAFANYLQFPDSTIQYTAAVAPSTLLSSLNVWIGENQFQAHTILADASLNGNNQIDGNNLTLPNLPPATTSKILYFDTSNFKVSYDSPPSILDLNNTWTAANGFMSDVSLNGANLYFGNIPNSLSDSFIAYSSSTKKISYTPSLLTSNNTYTGTNIYSNKITFQSDVSLNGANLYFGSIPSSSDANFIAYNSSTKQVSYTPSLLGSTNTWSATNSFQTVLAASVIVGHTGNFTAGKTSTGAATNSAGTGMFNCYTSDYAPLINPPFWSEEYNLFSTTTASDKIYCSAMAFCQTDATHNNIICKQPDPTTPVFTVLNIVCSAFEVATDNKVFLVLDSAHICSWYRETATTIFAYIAASSATNLMFVLYRVADNSTYGYFDATSGLWGSTSDERVKKDISPADLKLSKQFITDITPVTYRLKSDEITCKNLGFIAQDVLKNSKTISQKNIVANWEKYEEAVAKGQEPMEEWEDKNDKDAEGKPKKKLRKMMLGVSATGMIPEIVGCLKEMITENEELKLQVESQQTQISQQQKQITELQSKYDLLEDSVAMLLSKM